MEKVSITLQNQDLIERIIAANPDLEAKIHNAIIDGVSKRISKVVSGQLSDLVDKEAKKVEDNLLKHYFTEETGSYGYGRTQVLKSEYWEKLKDGIRRSINGQINELVQSHLNEKIGVLEQVIQNRINEKIAQIENYDIEYEIKKAIQKEVERRFNK